MPSADHEDNAKRRIDEELVSVDSLKHVLSTCCGCKLVHIHREQNDPPDFTVMIDGESFPTEVTSIVSRQQYHAQCDEFAKAIRDRADSLGILSGKYVFVASRLPRIPKPASKDGRQLIDAAVTYIDATLMPRENRGRPLKSNLPKTSRVKSALRRCRLTAQSSVSCGSLQECGKTRPKTSWHY